MHRPTSLPKRPGRGEAVVVEPARPLTPTMLDELTFDGVGPSPAVLHAWEESARSSRSATPEAAAAPPATPEAALALERERSARLERELAAARASNGAWAEAASALVNMLFLSPTSNAGYAASVEGGLAAALTRLSFTAGLRYCDCSFPASDASRPRVELRRWSSLEDSEWDLTWAPAWTCEACVDGQRGISFSTLLRVTGLAVEGRLALAFSADLTTVSVQFARPPRVHLDVACHVTLGQMPLPFQAELGRLVRDEAAKLIANRMVAPNAFTMTLRSKKELTDGDLAAAEKAARIGADRARLARAGSWGPSPSPPPKGRRRP